MILKTSKKAHEVMLFDMEKYIYSENLFNSLYIKMKHNVKKCSLVNKSVSKIRSFFLTKLQLIKALLLFCDSYMTWTS